VVPLALLKPDNPVKSILYECPFIPPEWIAAHGFAPCRVYPSIIHQKMDRSPTGVCPYTRRLLNHFKNHRSAAVILTTTCDQIRHLSEQLESSISCPVFLLHVPKTWQTVNAFDYYRQELLRLGNFLKHLGGTTPSHLSLKEIMMAFHTARQSLLQHLEHLQGQNYCEVLNHFFSEGSGEIYRTGRWQIQESILESTRTSTTTKSLMPVAVVGSPLAPDDFALWNHMEKLGVPLSLDGTPTGECSLPGKFDPHLLKSDPSLALFDAYFYGIFAMFRRPNQEYFSWLKSKVAAKGIRGLILKYYAWCDTWHAEAQRLKESLDLPFLMIEAGDESCNNGHTLTRLEAFCETLFSSKSRSQA
jgi:benzoyl-CoA reductase/2-hydroxyglutaryl-CoA dehydratase subunit BcrC/BadD/HgdB